ncbi:XdhC family protein [Oscillatoria sp. CS-180]|uniref:XdhC family protein n=1 Tax=Oscillatoria sp. CS-180 TaxID=3021720 RepID=UPI00232D31B5|nr:XdhC/CoxI family protein [Oscillatoria sp. CS-180]MDB9525822.1 XdhC family protein [Oscillatoria sp. CS-180]
MTSAQAFYQQLQDRLHQGPVVLATIVKTRGSAPREVGAKMAICPDETIIGTIGGGAGEGKVIQQARQLLNAGSPQLVDIDLTGAPKRDIQGVCGGKVQVWLKQWSGQAAIALVDQILQLLAMGEPGQLVTPFQADQFPYLLNGSGLGLQSDRAQGVSDHFVEVIEPPPRLLIVGAGHVAAALAKVAQFADFQIAVHDDRAELVTPQRFPNALLLTGPMDEVLDKLVDSAHLYVALVARGYQQDLIAMQSILESACDYDYIGAIGSQKRIQMIYQALQQQMLPVEKLNPFYAPIGLDIGALTPEEIAVSICAELIKVRRGGTGLSLSQRMQTQKITTTPLKIHLPQR